MKNLSLALLLLLVASLAPACKSNPKMDQQQIIGKWTLTEMQRNGETSSMMDGLYLDFKSEAELQTNFNGEDELLGYDFNQSQIVQHNTNGQGDYTFTVESLSDTALVLQTNIQGFDFRFQFQKGGE